MLSACSSSVPEGSITLSSLPGRFRGSMIVCGNWIRLDHFNVFNSRPHAREEVRALPNKNVVIVLSEKSRQHSNRANSLVQKISSVIS